LRLERTDDDITQATRTGRVSLKVEF
jgi:hypothetical protein